MDELNIQRDEWRIEQMDVVQSAIEGLSSKNMFVRTECVDTLGSYCQNSECHKVSLRAAQALNEARGHEDERVASAAAQWLKELRDHKALPRGFVFKPYKGDRTARLYVRASPEIKAYLESKGESVADWIERKVKEEQSSL